MTASMVPANLPALTASPHGQVKMNAALFLTPEVHHRPKAFGGYIGDIEVSAYFDAIDTQHFRLNFRDDNDSLVASGEVVERLYGVQGIDAQLTSGKPVWVILSKPVSDALLKLVNSAKAQASAQSVAA